MKENDPSVFLDIIQEPLGGSFALMSSMGGGPHKSIPPFSYCPPTLFVSLTFLWLFFSLCVPASPWLFTCSLLLSSHSSLISICFLPCYLPGFCLLSFIQSFLTLPSALRPLHVFLCSLFTASLHLSLLLICFWLPSPNVNPWLFPISSLFFLEWFIYWFKAVCVCAILQATSLIDDNGCCDDVNEANKQLIVKMLLLLMVIILPSHTLSFFGTSSEAPTYPSPSNLANSIFVISLSRSAFISYIIFIILHIAYLAVIHSSFFIIHSLKLIILSWSYLFDFHHLKTKSYYIGTKLSESNLNILFLSRSCQN